MNMSSILFLPVGQLTGIVEVVGVVSLGSAVNVPLDEFESAGECLLERVSQ